MIIGAGPAGMSLAASLHLAGLDYVILERKDGVGGQLPLIHNDLDDFVVGVYRDGLDFVQKLIDFNNKYLLNIEFGCVVKSVDSSKKKIYFIQNDIEKIHAYDILVIATGSRHRLAEKRLIAGFEKDVYYRISHKLNEFDDKNILVVGGGDNATIAALKLSERGRKIILINKNEEMISRPDLVSEVYSNPKIVVYNNSELLHLSGEGLLEGVEIINNNTGIKQKLDIDKIVFKIGYLPNSGFVDERIDLDDKAYIKTKGKYQTNIEDAFAIGDIVSGAYKRIAIAMGHGTELGNYFLKEYLVK